VDGDEYNGVTYDTATTFNSFESCKLYEVAVTAKKVAPEPDAIANTLNFNTDIKIRAHANSIFIENAPAGSNFKVTDLSGRVLAKSKTQSSMHEVLVENRGALLVIVGNKAYKVVK
jgi:oligosaccharide reducing-end xylanase